MLALLVSLTARNEKPNQKLSHYISIHPLTIKKAANNANCLSIFALHFSVAKATKLSGQFSRIQLSLSHRLPWRAYLDYRVILHLKKNFVTTCVNNYYFSHEMRLPVVSRFSVSNSLAYFIDLSDLERCITNQCNP